MYLQLSFQVSTVWGRSGNFRSGAYVEVLSHLMFDFRCEGFVLGFLVWTPYATCPSCQDVPTAELQVKEHYSSLQKHGRGIYYSWVTWQCLFHRRKMTLLLWNPVTSTLREWCGLMNPSVIHNRILKSPIMRSSWAGNRSYCDFLTAMTLSCPEDRDFLLSLIKSFEKQCLP